MQETIILAPGANGTELLRTMAKFGKNTLGFRIMGALELAQTALMRSGISVEEDYLTRKEETSIISSFIKDIPYFASAAYSDAENLSGALTTLRSYIPRGESDFIHNEFLNAEFKEKNEAISKVYDQYLALCAANNRIDTISLIRKAMEQAEKLSSRIMTLKEYPLTPLEQALAETLATDEVETTSLTSLMGTSTKRTAINETPLTEKESEQTSQVSFLESYGSYNEIEAMIAHIYKNNLPLDECVIALPETKNYAQLIYDFTSERNIPVSFGCGVPVAGSNPARVLVLLRSWNNEGYQGIDALNKLLMSEAFDKAQLCENLSTAREGGISKGQVEMKNLPAMITMAGNLHLGLNREMNDRWIRECGSVLKTDEEKWLLNAVQKLSDELARGYEYILQTYSVIREGFAGRVDRAALKSLTEAIHAYSEFTSAESPDEIVENILSRSVCSENSREGALYVNSIGGALASLRKNLFIPGMCADYFPGSPSENYLLLDSDMKLFDCEKAPTSSGRIQQKKAQLDNLLSTAIDLGAAIHVSYSSYNPANLKNQNPSSALFEIYQKEHGENSTVKEFEDSFAHTTYFAEDISLDRYVGRNYNDDIPMIRSENESAGSVPAGISLANRHFSPSAIDDFFACPYHFYLTRVLYIPEVEETDPFEIINAAELGTLVHSQMERLAAEYEDEDTFLERAEKEFDDFLKIKRPLHKDAAAIKKKEYLDIIANAYRMDPNNEVLGAEDKKECFHESGVTIYGYPDRVEKTKDGEYIIADFKTGKNIKHKPDDHESCRQVLIYAYMMEKEGKPISRCEYRYLRDAKVIHCKYDEEMKAALNEDLTTFKNALESGHFPKEKNCTYCKCKSICGGISSDSNKKEEKEAEA